MRAGQLNRRSLLAATVLSGAAALAGCDSGRRPSPGARSSAVSGQRLVTLDGATAEIALLTRRPQVGTVSFMGVDAITETIDRLQPEPVTDLGDGGEINTEELAELMPERIVGLRHGGGNAERLQALAPTELINASGKIAQDAEALGAAMGVAERTREVVALMERRRADLTAWVDRQRRLPTVSVLSPGLDGGSLYVPGKATPAGGILAGLDLGRPKPQRSVDAAFQQVSVENLPGHDADLIFLLTGPTADPSFLSDESLWANLRAVRAGRVITVEALRWSTLSSPLGALWVLDDLEAVLRRSDPPIRDVASPEGMRRLRRYRGDDE